MLAAVEEDPLRIVRPALLRSAVDLELFRQLADRASESGDAANANSHVLSSSREGALSAQVRCPPVLPRDRSQPLDRFFPNE